MVEQRGQAAVEAVLVLPVVLALLGAVLAFGLLFGVDLVVCNASREGARLGSLGRPAAEIRARIDAYLAAARLAPDSATVAIAGAGGASGTDVSVDVSYPVTLPMPLPGFPNPASVHARATMRIE